MHPGAHEDARGPASAGLAAAIQQAGGLASQADLARRWEITRGRVSQLAGLEGFPAPVATVSGQPVWTIADADAWRQARAQTPRT